LRKARATVAQLAANEERLRLARDLHDLLGHSLSLITLKSELAGRMLPDHPDKAAQQVADIEQVSRQALVDVREAVTGYRRPRLSDELAGAQVALTAAGVEAHVPAEPDLGGVADEGESTLAWALREAVTNVVRHSGASRCTVDVLRRQTLDGAFLELSVEDNGSGGPGTEPGNGLTGLAERLEKAGGQLEAGRVKRGFRLVARVPLTSGGDVGSRA
jgi:two-component system sensor histidine kinase DesK